MLKCVVYQDNMEKGNKMLLPCKMCVLLRLAASVLLARGVRSKMARASARVAVAAALAAFAVFRGNHEFQASLSGTDRTKKVVLPLDFLPKITDGAMGSRSPGRRRSWGGLCRQPVLPNTTLPRSRVSVHGLALVLPRLSM